MLADGAFFELVEGGLVRGELLGGGHGGEQFGGLSGHLGELLLAAVLEDLAHFFLVEGVYFVVDEPEDALADLAELLVAKKRGGLHEF